MINRLTVIRTQSTNPYRNLALEETLLSQVADDEVILYLWQNRQTVVIGRNQSALAECRVQSLESDGGFLARRLSGGGAVYHDLGNVNFTFIARTDNFNKDMQTDVILHAVKSLGLDAEKNGRNDLTVDGRKFSGHAYYKTKDRCYHHGTVMLYVDKEKLTRYLNVSPLKLKTKGVSSVKSRVVNLCELDPAITVEKVFEQLKKSFSQIYGHNVAEIAETDVDTDLLKKLEARYSSPEYKYGSSEILPHTVEARFDWGQVRTDFELSKDPEPVFTKVLFYTDGLDADYLSHIKEYLLNTKAEKESIFEALTAFENNTANGAANEKNGIAGDITNMLTEYLRRI